LTDYKRNATITRARAIYGKRLSESDYRELSNKKSVSEAAEYLKKNTHYSSALSTINTATIHRGHLEPIIRRYSFDRCIALCDFQQLRKERFYNYLIVLSEIREILSIILHMNSKSYDDYITSMPSYLLSKTSFDLMALARSRNINELIDKLEHTPYYSVLKGIQLDESGNAPYLECEIRLRTYYMKWLEDVVKKDFKGNTKNILLDQINIQVDFINIINAYRMKKFYGLSVSEIEKNSFPFYGKLSLKKQKELFGAETTDDFLNEFSKTFYGRKFKLDNDDYFELELNRLRCQAARRSLMFSNHSAVSVYSLIYLLDIEVDNITTIIEGIRYGKTQNYILNMIISI